MSRSRPVHRSATHAKPGSALRQNKVRNQEPTTTERRRRQPKGQALSLQKLQREAAGYSQTVDPQCPDLYVQDVMSLEDDILQNDSCRESLMKQWEKERIYFFPRDDKAASQMAVKGSRKGRDARGKENIQSTENDSIDLPGDIFEAPAVLTGLAALEEKTMRGLENKLKKSRSTILPSWEKGNELPLLTDRQEKILGTVIQRALPLLKELSSVNDDRLSMVAAQCVMPLEEARQLLNSGLRAKQLMVQYNMRLVRYCVRMHVGQCPKAYFADLVLEGMGPSGLERAVLGFDPRRGHRFSTYAIPWIQKGIRKCVANESSPIRIPESAKAKISKISTAMRDLSIQNPSNAIEIEALSAETGLPSTIVEKYARLARKTLSLENTVSKGKDNQEMESLVEQIADPRQDPLQAVHQEQVAEIVNMALGVLDPNERAVIAKRYGIDTEHGQPMTLAEIAEEHGLTGERVRQIEKQSRRKLRKLWKKPLMESDLIEA